MSWSEWAYSNDQSVPGELVSRNTNAIDELVQRDGGGKHGQGVYKTGSAADLNTFNVYPVVRVHDPHSATDIPDTPAETYEDQDGGKVYQISQSYTAAPPPPPPTLDEQKAAVSGLAHQKRTNYLNGGFEHLTVLYESGSDHRDSLAAYGAQAGLTGGAFSTGWPTADGAVTNFPDKASFEAFYNDYYLHLETVRSVLVTALAAIVAATDSAGIQAALDAMPDPLNAPGP